MIIIFLLFQIFFATNAVFVSHNVSSCNGAFDVYFVLDLSASLLKGGVNHFKQDTVSFVKQLVNKFTSPFLRFSFITFNDHANVVMPLTSDKRIVERKLIELRLAIPDGDTHLNLGLGNATVQIKAEAQKRASVIILLTDGILQNRDKKKAVEKSNAARRLGATVLAVGVGRFNSGQLLEIVGGNKNFLFKTESFDGLNKMVNSVLDESCLEITSASPSSICTNSSFELDVKGKGFDKAGSYAAVQCSYLVSKQKHFLVTPVYFSPTRLTCPSPNNTIFLKGDVITLQVSLNGGVSFISSNVTIATTSCGVSGGVAKAMVFIFLLFLTVLLWWFANALFCAAKTESSTPKQKPTRPMPPPPPSSPSPATITETQQWPIVDASYYGGRGAGGINPMKVQWGDRGCTEAGMHLEKAKDAVETGFVLREVNVNHKPRPPLPPHPPSSSSCCSKHFQSICGCLTSSYSALSKRRPTSTDLKNCIFIRPPEEISSRTRMQDRQPDV